MNSEAIADRIVDLEASNNSGEAVENETLMDDESFDQELKDLLAETKQNARSSTNDAVMGRDVQSGAAGVGFKCIDPSIFCR